MIGHTGPMDSDQLLSTTRAIRRRYDLDRPVEREVILDCLRLAIQAPTGSNAQGWRWIVVTDPATREQLAQHYREGGEGYLRAAAEGDKDPQTQRVYESAIALLDVLPKVPVHVIPCQVGRVDKAPNAIAAPYYGSILPAAWSFQLALRSRGLGSCWTTLHLFRERQVAELLGIPEDVTQVALIPVGYTTGGDFKPATRRPIEELTYFERWGQA